MLKTLREKTTTNDNISNRRHCWHLKGPSIRVTNRFCLKHRLFFHELVIISKRWKSILLNDIPQRVGWRIRLVSLFQRLICKTVRLDIKLFFRCKAFFVWLWWLSLRLLALPPHYIPHRYEPMYILQSDPVLY